MADHSLFSSVHAGKAVRREKITPMKYHNRFRDDCVIRNEIMKDAVFIPLARNTVDEVK